MINADFYFKGGISENSQPSVNPENVQFSTPWSVFHDMVVTEIHLIYVHLGTEQRLIRSSLWISGIFSTELPFLWNVLSPHNYHLLQTPWTSISVRCPCSVRTPLSALRPGVGLQANNWDSHRMHLTSFPFLRNESCTDSCSMSENSCFMYLVQTSSCLRWKRNLGPRTSSRPNRIGF